MKIYNKRFSKPASPLDLTPVEEPSKAVDLLSELLDESSVPEALPIDLIDEEVFSKPK